jgi:hypothetical protein
MRSRPARLNGSRGDLGRAAGIRAHHDALLFDAAFPASLAKCRAARRALDRFGRIVAQAPASVRAELEDSGIAGTATSDTFAYGVARWLAAHGERLRFDWERDRDAERLDPLIRATLLSGEEDRFDSGEVTTKDWLTEASRGDAVRWLLAAAPDARDSATGRHWRSLFEAADLALRWDLGDSPRSSSRNRVRLRPVIRTAFRGLPPEPASLIGARLGGIRRLRGAEAGRWHESGLAALAARAREVFPTVYANPDEVVVAPLGAGTSLCLLGAAPRDRSPLEANYGYVMFSNGIPVGYGGFTALGDQCNTGVNVFESFRGSEAGFLFAQSLRAARTYLGISRFVVNPYQFGAGNREAIESGAFWFYYRLGFRPVEPSAAHLAQREQAARSADRAHRSSAHTLRALARGDLVLDLRARRPRPLIPEQVLITTGAIATRALASVGAAERGAWIEQQTRRLRRTCAAGAGPLTAAERLGASHLVPILASLVPRIARWPLPERRALWRLVALKGAPQEAGFARAAAGLPRLWRMLGVIET